ncbi:hypothetical protein, partial [Ilumatobacter sp.]|uniref:hypothetical protein n=1 Tax=Ilumatobacter sp. TaxID=1967498 RepID=UPI0037538D89
CTRSRTLTPNPLPTSTRRARLAERAVIDDNITDANELISDLRTMAEFNMTTSYIDIDIDIALRTMT